MKLVIAVDPGRTTGLAICRFYERGHRAFKSIEVDDWRYAIRVAVNTARTHRDPDVVVEHFTIRPDTHKLSPQLDALYAIGALEYLAEHEHLRLTHQEPATAKRMVSNDRLEAIGWRNPTAGGHADDAARHLVVRAVGLGLINPLEFEPGDYV